MSVSKELVLLLRDKYSFDPSTAETMAKYLASNPGARDAFPGAADALIQDNKGDSYHYIKGLQTKERELNNADAARNAPTQDIPANHPVISYLVNELGFSPDDAASAFGKLQEEQDGKKLKEAEAMRMLKAGKDAYGRPVSSTLPLAPAGNKLEIADAKKNQLEQEAMEYRGASEPNDLYSELHDAYRNAGTTLDASRVEVKRPFDSITVRPGAGQLPSTNYMETQDNNGQTLARVPLITNDQHNAILERAKNEQISAAKMLAEHLHAQDAQNAADVMKGNLWSLISSPIGGNK